MNEAGRVFEISVHGDAVPAFDTVEGIGSRLIQGGLENQKCDRGKAEKQKFFHHAPILVIKGYGIKIWRMIMALL